MKQSADRIRADREAVTLSRIPDVSGGVSADLLARCSYVRGLINNFLAQHAFTSRYPDAQIITLPLHQERHTDRDVREHLEQIARIWAEVFSNELSVTAQFVGLQSQELSSHGDTKTVRIDTRSIQLGADVARILSLLSEPMQSKYRDVVALTTDRTTIGNDGYSDDVTLETGPQTPDRTHLLAIVDEFDATRTTLSVLPDNLQLENLPMLHVNGHTFGVQRYRQAVAKQHRVADGLKHLYPRLKLEPIAVNGRLKPTDIQNLIRSLVLIMAKIVPTDGIDDQGNVKDRQEAQLRNNIKELLALYGFRRI